MVIEWGEISNVAVSRHFFCARKRQVGSKPQAIWRWGTIAASENKSGGGKKMVATENGSAIFMGGRRPGDG